MFVFLSTLFFPVGFKHYIFFFSNISFSHMTFFFLKTFFHFFKPAYNFFLHNFFFQSYLGFKCIYVFPEKKFSHLFHPNVFSWFLTWHILIHTFFFLRHFFFTWKISHLSVSHMKERKSVSTVKRKSLTWNCSTFFHLFSSAQKRTHSHALFSTQIHIWNIILKSLEFLFVCFTRF